MLASLIGFFFPLGEKCISGNILFTNTLLYKQKDGDAAAGLFSGQV